ncbi:MAG: aldolase/citrate lyase family protein [Lacrimispora sp.]|uniref:HpcH/HpaI aldolase family protein n=1 Tax=Lacrimispora sp. TaxID=2719234 RepID=UPI0039E43B61
MRRILKDELRNGKPCTGIMLQHLMLPEYIDFVRYGNPDWLLFDLEHTVENIKSVSNALWACLAYDIPAIARVRDKDEWMIEATLDAGFQGIVVPTVETAEEARKVVRAAKYTMNGDRSRGDRGWCPTMAPTRWLNDYSDEERWTDKENEKRWNRDTFVGIILETPKAFENLDEILQVEGIDAVWPGPGDLSMRMGKYMLDPEVQKILLDADVKATKAGKIVISAVTPENIRGHYDSGARMFLMLMQEIDFLTKIFKDGFEEIRGKIPG